jgi:hypothetical protein
MGLKNEGLEFDFQYGHEFSLPHLIQKSSNTQPAS